MRTFAGLVQRNSSEPVRVVLDDATEMVARVLVVPFCSDNSGVCLILKLWFLFDFEVVDKSHEAAPVIITSRPQRDGPGQYFIHY